MNVLQLTAELTAGSRRDSADAARSLGAWIRHISATYRFDTKQELVMGEDGVTDGAGDLLRIAHGRTKKEGGGPVSDLEAWMRAEVVAASLAAGHEHETAELVGPEQEAKLREELTRFALQGQ